MGPVERCPVCDGHDVTPFAMNPWTPGTFHFAQARRGGCGLLIAQSQAPDSEIDRYYRRAYYQEQWPDRDAVMGAQRRFVLGLRPVAVPAPVG